MIIARSPLRISFGGGGTDLPSYYQDHGGFLLAAAINKYVFVSMHETTRDKILLRYSKIEERDDLEDIQHPVLRESLRLLELKKKNIEITSMADVPAGTGLGSSGSFTTALLKAIKNFKREFIEPRQLAELACRVEIDLLKDPIGKQDQYIAAYGGLTKFTFEKNGHVIVEPLRVSDETLILLRHNLLLFSTRSERRSTTILSDQDTRTRANDSAIIENLHQVKESGHQSVRALESGDLNKFATLLHEQWEFKKARSPTASNDQINHWYKVAQKNGAIGGKLIGAGGGGFLMFYTEEPTRLRAAMKAENLPELQFDFDFEGTKLLT